MFPYSEETSGTYNSLGGHTMHHIGAAASLCRCCAGLCCYFWVHSHRIVLLVCRFTQDQCTFLSLVHSQTLRAPCAVHGKQPWSGQTKLWESPQHGGFGKARWIQSSLAHLFVFALCLTTQSLVWQEIACNVKLAKSIPCSSFGGRQYFQHACDRSSGNVSSFLSFHSC